MALPPALASIVDRLGDRAPVLLLVAIAYFVLAKMGLALASLHPSASPVWPPSGLALGAMLLWGVRAWPAVAVGAFLANATTFGSLTSSLAIAAGNTLEAVVTAWLLVRFSGGASTFDVPSRVARFAAFSVAPGAPISATVGVGSLVLTGNANPQSFGQLWITWWLGDIGGLLLVAPAIVLWARSRPLPPANTELRDLSLLLAATVAVGLIAFSPFIATTTLRGPLAFLTIAPLLWAALRHRQRDTATAALVLSAIAIAGTLANGGPFARPSLNESFLLVLSFVISTAVPSLVLSADVSVRRRVEQTQRLLIGELNHRVKNTLATVQSIANQTVRTATDPAAFAETFGGRIQALSRAHALMTRASWDRASLHDLLREQVLLGNPGSRVAFRGPEVRLEPQAALHFAMVLHELGTNARKHGALASPSGSVSVTWTLSPDRRLLDLRWTEMGGASSTPDARRGFGRTFLEQALPPPGFARMRNATTGVVWEIGLPLPEQAADGPVDTLASIALEENGSAPVPAAGELQPTQIVPTAKRILIVEDEPLVAMDVQSMLQNAGMEIVGPAATSERALRLLGAERVDAALLDANLGGERVDGVALALSQSGIPFAFATGYGRESLPQAFAGAPVITKPFAEKELLRTVQSLLSSRNA
jgi:two-component sensor histidine kinase